MQAVAQQQEAADALFTERQEMAATMQQLCHASATAAAQYADLQSKVQTSE